jgi:hypothetical protein
VPDQECCVPVNVSKAGCQGPNQECSGGISFTCDEAADCPNAGDICCISTTGGMAGGAGATYKVSCTTPAKCTEAQICRSDGECPAGNCQLWKCALVTLEACTSPGSGCTKE